MSPGSKSSSAPASWQRSRSINGPCARRRDRRRKMWWSHLSSAPPRLEGGGSHGQGSARGGRESVMAAARIFGSGRGRRGLSRDRLRADELLVAEFSKLVEFSQRYQPIRVHYDPRGRHDRGAYRWRDRPFGRGGGRTLRG